MPPVGFESTIPASERSQTHALDRATTGIGRIDILIYKYIIKIYDLLKPIRIKILKGVACIE
jgi:hypothetical protein